MGYLDVLRQMKHEGTNTDRVSIASTDDHDDIDDQTLQGDGITSSMSSWSYPIQQLHDWLEDGYLHTLPDPVPGFADDLARYRDRATLIAFTRHILACAPWSLTGEERAAQFVAVLAPLMEGRAA